MLHKGAWVAAFLATFFGVTMKKLIIKLVFTFTFFLQVPVGFSLFLELYQGADCYTKEHGSRGFETLLGVTGLPGNPLT